MEVIDYYYKILGIKHDATNDEIIKAFNGKIKKFLYLPFYTESQKTEILELKKARYLLCNQEMRKTYDNIIISHLNEMNKLKDKNYSKKDKVDSTIMGDRVFSMVGILNIPQKNVDMDRNFKDT